MPIENFEEYELENNYLEELLEVMRRRLWDAVDCSDDVRSDIPQENMEEELDESQLHSYVNTILTSNPFSDSSTNLYFSNPWSYNAIWNSWIQQPEEENYTPGFFK